MKIKIKAYLFTILGLIISTVPVIIATLSYFPIWKNRGTAAMLSGFTLLLLLIGITPIFKFIKRVFSSPSVYSVWFIIFILFSLLKNIAEEVTIVAFVGFISNLIGAFIFRYAKKTENNNEKLK